MRVRRSERERRRGSTAKEKQRERLASVRKGGERARDDEGDGSGTRRVLIVGRTGAIAGCREGGGRIAGAAREDIDIFGRGARIAEEARGCAGG